MPVNRHDYEHWFLLYVDHELTQAERAEVEAFAEANPDLAEELQLLMGSRLQAENVSFPGKDMLLKQPRPDAATEEQLLLLLDQELSPAASENIIARMQASPEITAAWELLQQTKLQPEADIRFPDKQLLYRREPKRVVPMRWWQLAAAALLIGAGLWGTVRWMNGEQGMGNREERTKNEMAASNLQPREQGMGNREERTKIEVAATNLQPSTVNLQPNEQGMTNREERTKNEVAASNPQPSTFNLQPSEQGMGNREERTKNEMAASNLQPSTVNLQSNEQGMTNREERTKNEVAATNLQPREQGMGNREEGTANEPAASNLQPSTVNLQPSSGGSSDVVYASFDEDDDEERPRKSKVGAFFRRAKRVFERKTKIKTGNSEDVRIANMTFAMH